MRAKRFKNIDYGFRPESYDLPANLLQAILADVQGTARRAIIRHLEARGQLSDLPAAQLQQLLDGQRCDSSAAIHPTFMGGEYLPSFEKNEVEIARIELESTTADVISIRAKIGADLICYSIYVR